MEFKFRYKKAYIERTKLGYPIGYVDSKGVSYCNDCAKCIWFKFKFKNYWAISIYDGTVHFVKLRVMRYGENK